MSEEYEDESKLIASSIQYDKQFDNTSPINLDSLIVYEDAIFSEELKSISKNDKKSIILRDVLNSILPARRWIQDNKNVTQPVSSAPSTREDVINLQLNLDERLLERQARENGVCPVREELYSQCLDELIRQVCIECPERGILLLRVRDEVRMTIAAYSTLYDSSITFGMRKTLQAEQGNTELQEKIEELEIEKKKLERRIQELRNLYDAIEKRESEKRVVDEKKRQKEKEFLRFQSQHLESFLKSTTQ